MGIDCNLRDQLTFYGSFHANKWNQLIHFVFVPVISWSFLVWLAYTPELIAYDVYKHLPSGTPAWARTVATSACRGPGSAKEMDVTIQGSGWRARE